MFIDFLLRVFDEERGRDAIIWRHEVYSYGWLLDRVDYWQEGLGSGGVAPGSVTALEADFSPSSIALFLALVERGCIVVPLTESVEPKKAEFLEIAQSDVSIQIDDEDRVDIRPLASVSNHDLYAELRRRDHPGLVLFSSGSTGESKAALHDMVKILQKFKVRRSSLRAMTFLLYDHIGGVNTMLYQLSNAGCIVTVQERSPDAVLAAVERYQVELLPTSPTFMNLILLSEAYKRYDLSSLRTVSYGTEPMPESTLKRFHRLLPSVRLLQTYGLSEVGILRSKSKSSDSLWVKVGGEGFETRVVNGVLQIRAESAMLGYLNAPSPFTEDGWLDTGDMVEEDGDFIRILGRESEIINVGGEKVYPAEVESVVQEMEDVAEVTVYGMKNPIVGNIVCAKVRLSTMDNHQTFARRLKRFCGERLSPYKVPVKVEVATERQHSDRFKKARNLVSGGAQ